MGESTDRIKRSSKRASAHALSRKGKREGKKSEISLGTLTGVLAILAPFAGYLLAYGWRSGEAQFYGINQELIGISLEDCLRFALPLALTSIFMVVVASVDQSKREEKQETSKKRRIILAVSAIGFAICAVFSLAFAFCSYYLASAIALLFAGLCLGVAFASLLFSILCRRASIFTTIVILISYTVEVLLDEPIVTPIIVAVLLVSLLVYLAIEGAFSTKRGIASIKVNLVMPYCVIGVVLLGAIFAFAGITGFNAAEHRRHIVLDSGEVVLATYDGNRSVVGKVTEQGDIVAYRVVNLSDESQPWTITRKVVKGSR